METVMAAAARRWRLRGALRFAQLSPPCQHRGQRLDTVNHSRSMQPNGKVTTTTTRYIFFYETARLSPGASLSAQQSASRMRC
jgi:hypothetical protein